MGNYLFMNGGTPFTLDSDAIPCLDDNPRGEHLIKIAAAFEKNGIDGVRVEHFKEGDRVVLMLHLKPDSLAECVLNAIAARSVKTNHLPSVDLAIVMARHVQKMGGLHHD